MTNEAPNPKPETTGGSRCTSRRKLTQRGVGLPKAPLTRLKGLSAEAQGAVMAILKEHTYVDASSKVERLVGFACPARALHCFYKWFEVQDDLESITELLEQVAEFTRKQHRGWSAAKVREAAMNFFIAHATNRRDVAKFVRLVALDQRERWMGARAKLAERRLSLNTRRVRVLEAKAKAFDKARQVSRRRRLTPAQKQAEYRRILGKD